MNYAPLSYFFSLLLCDVRPSYVDQRFTNKPGHSFAVQGENVRYSSELFSYDIIYHRYCYLAVCPRYQAWYSGLKTGLG